MDVDSYSKFTLFFPPKYYSHRCSESKRPIRPDGRPGRTGGDSRTVRELPIDIELQGPTVASL